VGLAGSKYTLNAGALFVVAQNDMIRLAAAMLRGLKTMKNSMKKAMKLLTLVVVALMAVSLAGATATLSKTELTMGYNDEETVEFCISGLGGRQGVDVIVDQTCKDLDSRFGCQATDDFNADHLFTVSINQSKVNDGECVAVTLTANILNEEDAGRFYYAVNGVLGSATIGSETGSDARNNMSFAVPEIPEFGGITATLALFAAIGVYFYKRRS
jgi:hypothetical protein